MSKDMGETLVSLESTPAVARPRPTHAPSHTGVLFECMSIVFKKWSVLMRFLKMSRLNAWWWHNFLAMYGLRWLGRYFSPLHGARKNPIYKMFWFWRVKGDLYRMYQCKILGHKIIPAHLSINGLPGCYRCQFKFIPF